MCWGVHYFLMICHNGKITYGTCKPTKKIDKLCYVRSTSIEAVACLVAQSTCKCLSQRVRAMWFTYGRRTKSSKATHCEKFHQLTTWYNPMWPFPIPSNFDIRLLHTFCIRVPLARPHARLLVILALALWPVHMRTEWPHAHWWVGLCGWAFP